MSEDPGQPTEAEPSPADPDEQENPDADPAHSPLRRGPRGYTAGAVPEIQGPPTFEAEGYQFWKPSEPGRRLLTDHRADLEKQHTYFKLVASGVPIDELARKLNADRIQVADAAKDLIPLLASGISASLISELAPLLQPTLATYRPSGLPAQVQKYDLTQGEEYSSYVASQTSTQITQGVVAILQLDDGSGRTYMLRPGPNVVGRGQSAEFQVPDTEIARRHIEIRWDGVVALLSDLNVSPKTLVNNETVKEYRLADGDVIKVGHSAIIIRVHD